MSSTKGHIMTSTAIQMERRSFVTIITTTITL